MEIHILDLSTFLKVQLFLFFDIKKNDKNISFKFLYVLKKDKYEDIYFSSQMDRSFMKNCTRFHNYFAPIVIQRSVTTAWECLCHNQWGTNTGKNS